MRSEKELIHLLLDNEKMFNDYSCSGLCYFTLCMAMIGIINSIERMLLLQIIEENKVHSTFGNYYFELQEWQPRKEYLENLLKKYE